MSGETPEQPSSAGEGPADYTLHVMEEDAVFCEVDPDGRLQLFLHFYDGKYDGDHPFWKAICAWLDEDSGTNDLRVNFRLSDVLDFELEGHELFRFKGKTNIKAKPVLDAMRAELMQMVARIDAVQYGSPE